MGLDHHLLLPNPAVPNPLFCAEASTQLLTALAASQPVDASAFEALLAALSTAGRAEETTEWFRRLGACGIEPGALSAPWFHGIPWGV